MSPRFLGYGFAILGVLIISPDSALIRKVGMDPAALLFWRGFGIFVVSAVLSVLWYRGRLLSYFTESGVLGLLIALFFFISTCSFVYSAVTLNPIVLLIFVALGPVSGAVFSIILLNEPPRLAVWIAIGLSFLGMAIVVWGEMHGAGTLEQLRGGQRPNLPGPLSLLALILVPTLLGLGFTLARKLKQPNVWPSNALAGVTAMTIMPFIAPSLVVPSGIFWEFWFLVIFVSGVSFILITLAPKFISSAETSLVFLLETVLGTLWIWGLLGQRPEGHEIAGGAVVTLAVIVVVVSAARQKSSTSTLPPT